MDAIKFVENELSPVSELPSFKSGDTITVYYKIKEGNKERTQHFQGVVLQRRNTGANETDTREKLWLAYNIVGKVEQHLQEILDTGKLASKQLEDFRTQIKNQKF